MRSLLSGLVLAFLLLSAGSVPALDQLDIRVVLPEDASLEKLETIMAIDRVEDHVVYGTLLDRDLERLRMAGFVYSILPRPKISELQMCPEGWAEATEPAWNCYPTYSQYVDIMHQMADQHPEVCRLESLGASSNQLRPHEILALKITDNPDSEEAEPEIFLTSTMHGDELGGYILLLRLAWTLVANPDEDPALTKLIDSTEIWINPLANPDGTYFGGDETVAGAIRYLSTPSGEISGIDPNRNYPDFVAGPFPYGQPWAVETLEMMHFASLHSFVLSANLHAGAEVVNYPWDSTCALHPDDQWFAEISSDWALDAQEDGPAGYMDDCFTSRCTGETCPMPGVTKGADWYSVAGGRQDWMTSFRHGREVTVEISHEKQLPSAELEGLWQSQRRALVDFVGQAQRGIHGMIRDTGDRPLPARIEVLNHDDPVSTVFTDPDVGDFHRMLLPGVYDLRISSAGMEQLLVGGIVVGNGPPYPQPEITMEGIAPLLREPLETE